ncbi:hypothetical protein NQZ79_g5085 [Umbelopsis isabellina]|nr:hypothetical protein NQZ79_g5085 [Umbelopsis isabellina]
MSEETPKDLKETEQAVEDAFQFNDDEAFHDVVDSLDIETPTPENLLQNSEALKEHVEIPEDGAEKEEENLTTEPEQEEEKHEELENVVHALQDSFQQMSTNGDADKPKDDSELVGLGLVLSESATDSKIDEDIKEEANGTELEDGLPKINTNLNAVDGEFIPPTPGTPPHRSPFESTSSIEDSDDIETYSANLLALNKVDIKNIGPNTLDAREQEKAGECKASMGVTSHTKVTR